MSLRSHVSPDIFLHIPSPSPLPSCSSPSNSALQEQSTTIIFFIAGNPGLIGYYHHFLDLLAESEEARGCVVFGGSLGGFEVESGYDGEGGIGTLEEEVLFPGEGVGRRKGKVWGLREQVGLCLGRVDGLVGMVGREKEGERASGGDGELGARASAKVRVILMGHSVGAWIALEMVRVVHARRLRCDERKEAVTAHGVGGEALEGKREQRQQLDWEVEAVILLTPTIMELALSEKGKMAEPLLGRVPYLPEMAQIGASALGWGLGERWMRWVVGKVTGLTGREGSGLETTVRFLGSKMGVAQSLFLARDELVMIKEDEWGEEVWGAFEALEGRQEGLGLKSPKLYFLFAHNDHWISDETREKILERRGARRHTTVVDEGLQHAWCLRQNEQVADRVQNWIGEIIESKK